MDSINGKQIEKLKTLSRNKNVSVSTGRIRTGTLKLVQTNHLINDKLIRPKYAFVSLYAFFFIINQLLFLPLHIFMLNNSYNNHYGV